MPADVRPGEEISVSTIVFLISLVVLAPLAVWWSYVSGIPVPPPLPGQRWQETPFDSQAPIPLHLWQTYRTKNRLPEEAAEMQDSWRR